MISEIYAYLKKHRNSSKFLIQYRMFKILLNVFYPFCCMVLPRKYTDTKSEIIVSLTSFPARLKNVHLTIETLLRQTMMPCKIILWLAKDQVDPLYGVPKKLNLLRKYGVEIRFCDDLKSHKKYFYAMQEYPDYRIITVDDDMFYPEEFVETLYKASCRFPRTVCGIRVYQIIGENDGVARYKDWIRENVIEESVSYDLISIGCEGILYPPRALDERAFNWIQIQELCPQADDLWLKAMETLNNIPTVKVPTRWGTYIDIMNRGNITLNEVNVALGKNDEQVANLIRFYPILKTKWISRE